MEYAEHRFTLNLHSALSHTSLAIKKGDTKHRLIISLAEGGEPYAIADGCMAVFLALKPDNTTIFDSCSIEDNRVIYDVSPQTVAAGGMVMCEVRIYGPEQGLLSSESFVILVDDSGDRYEEGIPSTDEFNALTETLSKAVEIFEAWEKLNDNEILMNFADALDVYARQGGGVGLPLIHEGGVESFSMMTVIGPGNSIPSGNIDVPCVEKVQELIKEEAGYIDVTAAYEAALAGKKVSCAKEFLWTLGVGRWHLAERFASGDVWQRYYLHVLLGEDGLKYRILADAQDTLHIALYNDVAYDADPFIAIEGDTGRVLFAGKPCAPTDLTVKDGKIYLSDHFGAFGEGIVVPTGRGNIYIGSGDMPEECDVQIDLNGKILDLASLMTEGEVDQAIEEALEDFEPPESGGGEEWELIVDYTVPEGVQIDTLEFTKDVNGNDFDLKKCIFYTVITATEEGSNSNRNINCITSKTAKKNAWTNGVSIGTSLAAGDPTSKRKGYMVYLEVVGNTYLTYGYMAQNDGSLWDTVGQSIFRSMNFDKTTNVMHDGCSDIAEINCFRIHSLGTNIMGVGSTIKIMGVRK